MSYMWHIMTLIWKREFILLTFRKFRDFSFERKLVVFFCFFFLPSVLKVCICFDLIHLLPLGGTGNTVWHIGSEIRSTFEISGSIKFSLLRALI